MPRLYDPPKMSRIFETAFLGPLRVKNRLIMAPMGTRMASEVGGVTQKQIDYYAERAKGGVGTIIVEITSVDYPLGGTGLTIHDNGYIGGHSELVEAVHGYGVKIICQLAHVGRQSSPYELKGLQPVAPSPIPCRAMKVVPRELSTVEAEEIVQKFIDAARRALAAGYDGVELHGAHGYLIAQFMSPCSNQRNDKYGGSLSNRMNFPLEIIRGIKKSLGKAFPLLFRFSAEEFVENGRCLEESKQVARMLEAEGVHVLDVSAGAYDAMPKLMEPMSYPEGWKIYLAEEIKKAVKIPVIGVGVIRTPAFAEKIIGEGKVDFVALGRALVADPHWPNKAREGRPEDISRCISCNIGCIGGRVFRDLPMRCSVNPATGREREFGIVPPAGKRRKVLVVGGGPAGMEAACLAKRRGHSVILAEKEAKLGGQLLLAAVPPGKEKINWYSEYLIGRMKKLKVPTRLKQEVTPAFVQKMKPDVVILATGAVPWIPDIPGIQNSNVIRAWDVLKGKKKIEGSTVVVAGGGTVGCETALYLAPQNRKVIVVEMLDRIALDMEPINRMDLQEKIRQAGLEPRVKRKVKEITPESVLLENEEGREERIRADWIVLALGVKPNDSLFGKLEGKVPEIYSIGDCGRTGKIIDASYDGFRVARLI